MEGMGAIKRNARYFMQNRRTQKLVATYSNRASLEIQKNDKGFCVKLVTWVAPPSTNLFCYNIVKIRGTIPHYI